MKEKPIYEQLGYDPDPPFYASTSIPIVTNYDRLISKSPEELARLFSDYVSCHDCPIPYCAVRFTMERLGCQANWLAWLRQSADPGGE